MKGWRERERDGRTGVVVVEVADKTMYGMQMRMRRVLFDMKTRLRTREFECLLSGGDRQ